MGNITETRDSFYTISLFNFGQTLIKDHGIIAAYRKRQN